jgi:hypothetical protein
MPEQAPQAACRTALLDQYVSELTHPARKQYPEASIEVLPFPFEDEDAHILVYLPEGTSEGDIERLGENLTKRSVEIYLETDLFILAGVYMGPHHAKKAPARLQTPQSTGHKALQSWLSHSITAGRLVLSTSFCVPLTPQP